MIKIKELKKGMWIKHNLADQHYYCIIDEGEEKDSIEISIYDSAYEEQPSILFNKKKIAQFDDNNRYDTWENREKAYSPLEQEDYYTIISSIMESNDFYKHELVNLIKRN